MAESEVSSSLNHEVRLKPLFEFAILIFTRIFDCALKTWWGTEMLQNKKFRISVDNAFWGLIMTLKVSI